VGCRCSLRLGDGTIRAAQGSEPFRRLDRLMAVQRSNTDQLLPPGVDVEVRARFDGAWKRGFEIATVEDELYRIRRRSDGTVLPKRFDPSEVRTTR
jgi:hypothetical protein